VRVDGSQITLLAVNETQHLVAEVTTQPPDRAVQVTKQVMKTVKPTATVTNSQ